MTHIRMQAFLLYELLFRFTQDEFLEQIQDVQRAFDEERAEYDKQIASLKVTIARGDERLRETADKSDLLRLQEERDKAVNDRDEMQLEKNKVCGLCCECKSFVIYFNFCYD